MALATRLRAIDAQQFVNNITKNLASLQFESTLLEDEKKFLILREKNHAITVSHCALATVMVDVFNKTRKALLDTGNLDRKRIGIFKDEGKIDSISIGIIGCGRLGKQIAHCLLSFGEISPHKLKISTRRPEKLKDLMDQGVECYFNNKRLISSVHIVLICVLPSQMFYVAKDIKDSISSSHIIICQSSSLSVKRLSQILNVTNIIRPVLHLSSESPECVKYDYSLDINTALQNRETVMCTCPIGVNKAGLIVKTDQRLAETIILAVINLCTEQGLTQEQTLTIVHTSVFGESHKKPLTCDRLLPEHFGLENSQLKDRDTQIFPFYNLVDAFKNGTPLLKTLLNNESIQKAFVSRYWHLFEDYIHKQTYGHI